MLLTESLALLDFQSYKVLVETTAKAERKKNTICNRINFKTQSMIDKTDENCTFCESYMEYFEKKNCFERFWSSNTNTTVY